MKSMKLKRQRGMPIIKWLSATSMENRKIESDMKTQRLLHLSLWEGEENALSVATSVTNRQNKSARRWHS